MSTHICTIGAEASQITCLSWKNSVSSSVCVAMDGVAESEHHAPSLDISPAPTHQQIPSFVVRICPGLSSFIVPPRDSNIPLITEYTLNYSRDPTII